MSRSMANPKGEGMLKLKRLARYFKDKTRSRLMFRYQAPVKGQVEVSVVSDSDYAGCKKTRKSTSGGVLKFGCHMIKSWSATQAVIALSSGEAEYYAMVKGASQVIGLKNMIIESGVSADRIKIALKIKTDASAAIGMGSRRGAGKVRHIETNQLWLQEKVLAKEIQLVKIKGTENPADHLTMYLNAPGIRAHMEATDQWIEGGRHQLMPTR